MPDLIQIPIPASNGVMFIDPKQIIGCRVTAPAPVTTSAPDADGSRRGTIIGIIFDHSLRLLVAFDDGDVENCALDALKVEKPY